MWLESLRLAHHQTVAPAAPNFSAVPSELVGEKRVQATRALLASYPAPSVATLSKWEGIAEAVLCEAPFTQTRAASGSLDSARRKERELLALRLSERLTALNSPELPEESQARLRARRGKCLLRQRPVHRAQEARAEPGRHLRLRRHQYAGGRFSGGPVPRPAVVTRLRACDSQRVRGLRTGCHEGPG